MSFMVLMSVSFARGRFRPVQASRDRGLLVGVAKHISVDHFQGGSSGARPMFVGWHKARGMIRYLNIHHRGILFTRYLANVAIGLDFIVRAPALAWREWRAYRYPKSKKTPQ